MEDTLLTAKDAAKLLGVSAPTFKNICLQYNIAGIKVGARLRYLKSEVLKIIELARTSPVKKIAFNILSTSTISDIEGADNILDIRSIDANRLDPYGVLSLLGEILFRVSQKKKVYLTIDDSIVCQYLRSIGFFSEIESRCQSWVYWDREVLRGLQYKSPQNLMPLRSIRLKGDERPLSEKLINLLKQQGFKEDVRNYIGQIMGELADNSMTHSEELLGDRCCYFLVERFILDNKYNCVVIGIADTGQGIYNSLKTNPKYKNFTDKQAFLEAFRPYVSAWHDEARRGKGLADVLSIAMGNHSYLKVDSCEYSLFMDFRDEKKEDISWKVPISSSKGTRYGLILIDKDFEAIERKDIDVVIKKWSGI